MRADMGKVLVERPRLGRWRGDSRPGKGIAKRLKKCLDAGDSPPACEGIRRRHTNKKMFNEHLGPLRRFLASNVGRPWDAVYSEICAHVDCGNVVQKHILTHLFQYVATHVVLIDGQPRRGDGDWHHGESLRTSHRRYEWYVCPKSGLLRASRYVPRVGRPAEPPRSVRLNNKQVCVYAAGRWELLSVALLVQPLRQEPPAYDVLLQQLIAEPLAGADAVRVHRGNRYAVSRRVLSRRELLALPIPVEWLP